MYPTWGELVRLNNQQLRLDPLSPLWRAGSTFALELPSIRGLSSSDARLRVGCGVNESR
jgi:hypothetical protein